MKRYVVTYDLCRPGQDYTTLIKTLAALPGAVRFQLSSWLVTFAGDAVTLRDRLRPLMDANDKLFVAEVTQNAAWYAGTVELSGAISANYRLAA